MALEIVTNANFATTVGAAVGAGQVYVLLVQNFVPSINSCDKAAEATMLAAQMHYSQYSLTNVTFGTADSHDRTLLSTQLLNILQTPTFVFFVGDGVANAEYFRYEGTLDLDALKYNIERQRS